MTKTELLAAIADAEPEARIAFVDAKGFVIDVAEVLVCKSGQSGFAQDEVHLFRKRAA